MKDWILYSLKCRKSQAGFALPVAIGMGLIILLVGLTMLLRSQDSQVSAIAQKDTAKSLNAAETGVNEIRNLINDYRELAEFPACDGVWDSNNLCPDGSSIKSWKNPGNIANTFLGCVADNNSRITNLAKRTVWHAVDSTDDSQGEYRLIDYDVASDTGTLTVQGRVNAGQPSESVSQVAVQFRVFPSPSNLPGLWVRDSATTDEIDADILGKCNNPTPPKRITAQPINNHQARQLDLAAAGITMPAAPGKPDPSIDITNITTLPDGFSGELPRKSGGIPTDTPDSDGVYRYSISNIENALTINNSNPAEPLVRVELWVDGDINLQGQKINHDCGTRTNCGALTVRIFGPESSGNIILDQGTVVCNVFIHAPAYQVTNKDSGSSSSDDCGANKKNTGVFWVDTWMNSGSIRTPVLNPPIAIWADIPSTFSPWSLPNQDPNQPYPPQIGPIQSWVTQEQNPS